jgi:filamentous hemagglutinin
MRLAAHKSCVVPIEKDRDYLLNITHADGAPKAFFFNEVYSRFGVKYIVDCHFRTPDGRNPCIRTLWIEEFSGVARFVTAYPK